MKNHDQENPVPLSMLRKIAATITPEEAQGEVDRLRQRSEEIEAAYQRDMEELRREMTAWNQLMPWIVSKGTPVEDTQPSEVIAQEDHPQPKTTVESASPPAPNLAELILSIARETPAKEYWRGSEFKNIITQRGLMGGRTAAAVNMTLRRLAGRGEAERMEDGSYRFPTLSNADREHLGKISDWKVEVASAAQFPSPGMEG